MDKAVQWGIASGCGATGIVIMILLVVCSRSYKRRKRLLSESNNTIISQDISTQPNTPSFGNLQYRGHGSRNQKHKSQQNRLGQRNMMDRRSDGQRPKQTDKIKGDVDMTNQTGKVGNIGSKLSDKEAHGFVTMEIDTPAIFSRNVLFRDSHSLITRSYHGNSDRSSFYSLQDFPMDQILIPRAHLTSSSVQEHLV